IIDAFTDAIINAGGQIAIDDFGSGFSNLIYLFRINAQYIKIDGEIIKNICSDEYALEIMGIISQWAKKHNKSVIAEFVENEDIQKLVSDHGIKYSQGYYYSKPEKRFS
ncbi:MAG: EAL domain-containing protein, partial [Ruminococcus sp.]